MNPGAPLIRFLCLFAVLFISLSFTKKTPKSERYEHAVVVSAASSTFINAHFFYNRAGRLIRLERNEDESYSFTYSGGGKVYVVYKNGPSFYQHFVTKTYTRTSVDPHGLIKSSYSVSPQDTITETFHYQSSGKILFVKSVHKGYERIQTSIDGQDSIYNEAYSYEDSTAYHWSEGNLTAARIYINKNLAVEKYYEYYKQYSGRQFAPYNSGFPMLPSVTQISGITDYPPFQSRNLTWKEHRYCYDQNGDTSKVVSTVYEAIKIDSSGRLTNYRVQQKEHANGFLKSETSDEFDIRYLHVHHSRYPKHKVPGIKRAHQN